MPSSAMSRSIRNQPCRVLEPTGRDPDRRPAPGGRRPGVFGGCRCDRHAGPVALRADGRHRDRGATRVFPCPVQDESEKGLISRCSWFPGPNHGPSRNDDVPLNNGAFQPPARALTCSGRKPTPMRRAGSRRSNGIHPKRRTANGGDIFALLASTRPITRFCRTT
jgi:hypothetical protein